MEKCGGGGFETEGMGRLGARMGDGHSLGELVRVGFGVRIKSKCTGDERAR